MAGSLHTPVLLEECIRYLKPYSPGVYVDGTLGLGGHTEALLLASAPGGRVIGFDWDESALSRATERLALFGSRFHFQRRNFAELAAGLQDCGISEIDGLLLDVGLSSLQLDLHEGRGFSFQTTATERELADIFYYYGEERQARPIAAAIVAGRQLQPVTTTRALVDLVFAAVPKRFHPKKIHVATKTFQALRIAVNGELENLDRVIDEGVRFLKCGAVVCIISFHSLEDLIVKKRFREHPLLEVVTPRPIMASADEVAVNPRARSARLRVACRRSNRE